MPNRRPRPPESYSPKLLQILLAGALSKQILYAEEDQRSPEITSVNLLGIESEMLRDERVVKTRWHYCRFSSVEAAKRFKSFFKLAQRLHSFRRSMKDNDHPDTSKVYAVTISVDDRTGTLSIAPPDSNLDALLNSLSSPVAAPLVSTDASNLKPSDLGEADIFLPESDPLATIGDGTDE